MLHIPTIYTMKIRNKCHSDPLGWTGRLPLQRFSTSEYNCVTTFLKLKCFSIHLTVVHKVCEQSCSALFCKPVDMCCCSE